MKNEVLQRLLAVAGIGLCIGGIIFLCLSLFGYENPWTLPAALVCVALSTLFQIIFRQGNSKDE